MTQRTTKFLVELVMPSGVNMTEMKEYIRTEIQSGIGMRDPSDPLHHLDRKRVRVTAPRSLQRESNSNAISAPADGA